MYDCPGNDSPQNSGECSSSGNVTAFHQFPIGNPVRVAEWCELLSIDTDSDLGGMLVCRRHFSPQQYDFSSDSKNPLKADAVPDRHLPKIVRSETPRTVNKSKAAQRSTEDKFNPPVLVVNDLGKVCRLCLETDEQSTHETLFDKQDIVEFIAQSIGIEVEPNDEYPKMICQTCIERVTYIHRSREWFHKNDQFLKTLVGELSNEMELPLPEPTEQAIPTDDEAQEQAPEMFEAVELIECKEAVLEQIAEKPRRSHRTSARKSLLRMKRKQRKSRIPSDSETEEPFDIVDARSEMLERCTKMKSINGQYPCDCGVACNSLKRLLRHIMDEHDIHGNVTMKRAKIKVPQKKARADPIVLEQMAAVFNGLK